MKLLSSIVQKSFLPFQRTVRQQNYSLAFKTLRGSDFSPAFVSGSDTRELAISKVCSLIESDGGFRAAALRALQQVGRQGNKDIIVAIAKSLVDTDSDVQQVALSTCNALSAT